MSIAVFCSFNREQLMQQLITPPQVGSQKDFWSILKSKKTTAL